MAENSNNTNKLVGSLYLELDQLKADVKTANSLLSSIGKNIKWDLGESIERQVKSSLDTAAKSIKEKIKEIQQITSSMSSGSSSLSGSGFDVMKIKEQTDAYGNLTGVIIEGMDSAGNKIRQTVKDGE